MVRLGWQCRSPLFPRVARLIEPITISEASQTHVSTTRSRARRLIVMTRLPEAGRVKTRLIPVLGPDGAMAMHAALLRQTLQNLSASAEKIDFDIEVRFTGDTNLPVDAFRFASEVAREATWRAQTGGDLGERMHGAIAAAIEEGARQVIVVGTDCPDLSPDVIVAAWHALDQHDVVLGPADDGGYYLIGTKQADARLFAGVDWGTERVLRQTEDRCRQARQSVSRLPVLGDIDEAENLVICRRLGGELSDCLPRACRNWLSVVVPTLNEVQNLEQTVRPLLNDEWIEVVIADGGSTDGTVELARSLGCRVITANRGRGRQMNAGAALATGEYLLFLHADTQVPPNFFELPLRRRSRTNAIAGAFRLQINQPGWSSAMCRVGCKFTLTIGSNAPTAIKDCSCVPTTFFRVGGFKNWPLMEDYELCGRL